MERRDMLALRDVLLQFPVTTTRWPWWRTSRPACPCPIAPVRPRPLVRRGQMVDGGL